MKRKIRLALYVRVAFVLLGPGLYLLINIFISADNKSDDDSRVELTDNERLSRHVLSFSEARREGEVNLERLTPRLIPRSIRKAFRVVANVAFSCYCFLMLAILCDEYFIGSIEILCQKLHLNPNRAGATLMAVATSAPELFISCIGTFVTEGDVGVGTIVGSANFNILAVPACVGLFTRTSIQLEWWTVTRDCLFYGLSVLGFITVISDNQVMWYEAAALCGAYGVYLILMHKDDEKVHALTRKVLHRIRLHPDDEVSEISPLFAVKKSQQELSEPSLKLDATCDENCATNPWKVPRNASTLKFFLRWPITFMLWLTVPDARRFKSCYVLTFINCVLWISSLSYFVVFLSTNVDTVMGLTFLAAGTSMPEVVSSVIVTAQGFGSMGFHNSIHSNVFDILLCLGLPWLIKTLIAPTVAGQPWIVLESTGLSYSSISLLTTLAALYFAFLLNSFRLDRKIGIGCLALYLLFLLFALLVEFNIFFPIEPIDH